MTNLLYSILGSACLFTSLATATAFGNWPEFRGPTADGKTEANVPVEFGEGKNVLWKTDVKGKAWSSPVVWGDQVWVTNAFADGHKLYAICLDATSGKKIKELLLFEIEEPQFCIDYNSYGSPTPAIEEGRVYISFGAHGSACIDTSTFEVLWSRQDLECNHFRGPASSPIIDGDKLVLQFDGFDFQYVVALDKKTGETIWRHDRVIEYPKGDNGDWKKAYGTPAIITHEGRRQLICPSAAATESLNPETGDRYWVAYHDGMNAAARPVYGQGLVFITNGHGAMIAVPPEGTGDITDKIAWESKRQVPKKPSLILVDDMLYMIKDDGVLTCVEAKTGKIIYNERLKGEYDASPLYSNGRIYFFSKTGRVPVVKVGKEFELLADNQFDDGFMASPAVYKDSLILRTKSAVYRIGK